MSDDIGPIHSLLRRNKALVIVLFWCVLCVLWIIFNLIILTLLQHADFVLQHYSGIVLAPVSAAVAFCVITAFSQTEGPIRFKGLGFEFEGASGPVVLWVLCWLAIMAAIRLIW